MIARLEKAKFIDKTEKGHFIRSRSENKNGGKEFDTQKAFYLNCHNGVFGFWAFGTGHEHPIQTSSDFKREITKLGESKFGNKKLLP